MTVLIDQKLIETYQVKRKKLLLSFIGATAVFLLAVSLLFWLSNRRYTVNLLCSVALSVAYGVATVYFWTVAYKKISKTVKLLTAYSTANKVVERVRFARLERGKYHKNNVAFYTLKGYTEGEKEEYEREISVLAGTEGALEKLTACQRIKVVTFCNVLVAFEICQSNVLYCDEAEACIDKAYANFGENKIDPDKRYTEIGENEIDPDKTEANTFKNPQVASRSQQDEQNCKQTAKQTEKQEEKKSFWAQLAYDWVLYVVAILLAVGVWCGLYSLLHAPKTSESLYVFYAGRVTNSIANDAKEKLADKGVLLVSLSSIDPNDSGFATKYNVVGLGNCDLLILPHSVAQTTKGSDYFLPLADIDASYYEQGQLYYDQGVAYGVFLSEQAKEKLSEYFVFGANEYVVVLSAMSKNSGQEGCLTSNALSLFSLLINWE